MSVFFMRHCGTQLNRILLFVHGALSGLYRLQRANMVRFVEFNMCTADVAAEAVVGGPGRTTVRCASK